MTNMSYYNNLASSHSNNLKNKNTTLEIKNDFPNGNVVLNPQVVGFVERYSTFARKTAESIIGLAKTLVEAEQQLNGVDFSIFCDEVGIKKGNATYSKLRTIGMNASRFTPHMDNLPNTWTTIYQLAKLDPNKFDQISPELHPFTTVSELSEILGARSKTNTNKDSVDLTICFGMIGSSSKKEVYDTIIDLKKKFSFSVKEGQLFISEMKNAKLSRKVA